MISFYKLEQIVKIWMESVKTDKEVWYKTVGGGVDGGYSQTYELSPPSETHPPIDDVRFVFIHTITDSTIKNAKEFKICLDNINNPVFIITNDGLSWAKNDIRDNISKKFSDGHISKLRSMIINADKTLEDYLKEHPKFDTNFGDIYTYVPVVSGIAYISLDEIKELKKDPYKFCIENGIIENGEEMETENQVSKKDEILLKEIQQLVDGFENKRFAIASLLATAIDIGCGTGEKEGEKKCANCPLTSYTCREISNRAKMLLSDTCDEQTANEGNK